MSRNREATEARLLQAVGALIPGLGVAGLTASAIAEAAGVDRMLVTRYFGGLDGLLGRFAETHPVCWRADALTTGLSRAEAPVSRPATLTMVLLRYLRTLVREPGLAALLASELGPPGVLARVVSERRQQEEKRLFGALGQLLGAPLEPHEIVGLKTYMSAICLELIRRRVAAVDGAAADSNDLARLEAAITLGAAAQFGSRMGETAPERMGQIES